MSRLRNDLAALFDHLDGERRSPPVVRRAVLERILRLDPTSDRAWELLDGDDGFDGAPDELAILMDEAESLAARGLWLQARFAADLIHDRFGDDPTARAWLGSVEVLWRS